MNDTQVARCVVCSRPTTVVLGTDPATSVGIHPGCLAADVDSDDLLLRIGLPTAVRIVKLAAPSRWEWSRRSEAPPRGVLAASPAPMSVATADKGRRIIAVAAFGLAIVALALEALYALQRYGSGAPLPR